MRAFDLTSGRELARDLSVAERTLARAKGLLGKKRLPRGEGLLIRPCMGVHTFFMKFPIDVLFLNANNSVIAIVEALQPQRVTRLWFSATSVLELPAGTVRGSETVVGNEVVID